MEDGIVTLMIYLLMSLINLHIGLLDIEKVSG